VICNGKDDFLFEDYVLYVSSIRFASSGGRPLSYSICVCTKLAGKRFNGRRCSSLGCSFSALFGGGCGGVYNFAVSRLGCSAKMCLRFLLRVSIFI
jgi:hypothetical protein